LQNSSSSFDTFIIAKDSAENPTLSNELPLRVNTNEHKRIVLNVSESVFTTSRKDVSFNVIGVREDGAEDDVTSQCSFSTTSKIRIDKNSKTFSLEDDIDNGDYLMLARLGDAVDVVKIEVRKKTVVGFDFYICGWNEPASSMRKRIEIMPSSDENDRNANWLRCLAVLKFSDSTTETIDLPTLASTYSTMPNIKRKVAEGLISSENSVCLQVDRLIGMVYNARAVISAKYEGLTSYCYIDILKDRIEKLVIDEKSSHLNELNVGISGASTYELSVSALYKSGDVIDVTNDQSLSLSLGSHGNGDYLTQNSSLSISTVKFARPVIVNGRYENDDDCIDTDKVFFVDGYKFNGIRITDGDDESDDALIKSGDSRDYFTLAMYSNSISSLVSADYEITDNDGGSTSYLTWSVSNDKKTLSISSKKTMNDRHFTISSFYAEPGFENVDTERSLVKLNVMVQGGFNLSLSGTMIVADGNSDDHSELSFETPPTYVDSIDPDDFAPTYNKTYRISGSVGGQTELTLNLLRTVNDSGWNYQYVQVTRAEDSFDVIVPYDVKSLEKVYVKKGKTYAFRFFNILESMDCFSNNYQSAKEKRVISGKRFTTNSRVIIGDLAPGCREMYKEAIVKRNGSNVGDVIGIDEEYAFSIGTYGIEFIPISRKNNAQNKFYEFVVDRDINDEFILGIKSLSFGQGIQILDVIPTFETSTGRLYKQKMNYVDEINTWVIEDPPLKAARLKKILVAFAFSEEEDEED